MHLNVGLTSRFDNAIHSRQTPLTRRKPLKRETRHELFTEQVNKVALSSSDDTRIIRPDKIKTLAHGFRE